MSEFINERLDGLKPYVPGEQPKNIKNLVKLNTNENPFPPSPKAIKAGRNALKNLNRYSDPDASELKKALAVNFGVNPENVTVGNGSDEILAFLFAGFCDKGAIINDVTYGFYEVFADMFGVKKTVVPLKEDFSIDVADYDRKKGTVFIANPNAPTGLTLPLGKIKELADCDKKRLVVVDEAYVDFGGESAVKLLPSCRNIAVVGTFSKSRSLAAQGWDTSWQAARLSRTSSACAIRLTRTTSTPSRRQWALRRLRTSVIFTRRVRRLSKTAKA